MTATLENPEYTVYLVAGTTKYNLTSVIEDISMSNQEKQIAQRAALTIMNIKVKDQWLSDIIRVRQRVFIEANDGSKKDEVFRGWVWTRYLKTGTNAQEITVQCYDNLIYFQESEDSKYFSSGWRTDSVMKSICNDWGVTLNYSYETISHSKLVLRGTLSDIFTADILDTVKERTGTKYVIISQKDVMYVKPIGQNTTVYNIKSKNNALTTRNEQTMDGMITKVIILGKADDNDRQAIEATVSGDTTTYGTLQKIEDRNENTSLADAKKEAQNIIKENGTPKWLYEVTAPDIPWIVKGDKVHVETEDINSDMIVLSIDRDISNRQKTMSLTCEKA